MHRDDRYFVTTICIDTADPLYRDSHETICITILEKDQSKHIFFLTRLMEIIWYRLGKVGQSHVSVQPAAVVVVGTPSTGVAGCVRYFWSQMSVFMLLTASLWHLTVLRYVSRYVSYRDLCIEIRIVSWGTCIVTPLWKNSDFCYFPLFKACLVPTSSGQVLFPADTTRVIAYSVLDLSHS